MDTPVPPRARLARRRGLLAGGAAAVMTVAAGLTFTHAANAATEFSANFEDDSISSWSKSGGTWSVVTDGSRVARQSKTDERERPAVQRLRPA